MLSATVSTIRAISLSAEDRPSALVQGYGIRHVNGVSYTSMAAVNVETDGSIEAYACYYYNDASHGFTPADSNINATVIWAVG